MTSPFLSVDDGVIQGGGLVGPVVLGQRRVEKHRFLVLAVYTLR